MSTLRQDLIVREGTSFSFPFAAGVDLTGYKARAAVRYAIDAVAEVYFSTEGDAEGGVITLDGATATLTMTPAQTERLAGDTEWLLSRKISREIRLFYDLELEAPDGSVTRPIEGTFTIIRSIT